MASSKGKTYMIAQKKSLMIRTAEEIALLKVGDIKKYKVQDNNTKVFLD